MALPEVLKNITDNLPPTEKIVGGVALVGGAILGLSKMFEVKLIHIDSVSGMPYVKGRDGVRLDPVKRLPVDTRNGYYIID